MQDKIAKQRELNVPLKFWRNYIFLGLTLRNYNFVHEELKERSILGLPTTLRSIIFIIIVVYHLKTRRLKYKT